MAQISIPMSNKVGYSMYWNSMWDNKINYARGLKEDIYLNKFIPLLFRDKISKNIFKTVDFSKIDLNKMSIKYNLHTKVSGFNRKSFYKYLSEINRIKYFKSKVWILKYQKWLIIYFFIYLPFFNKFKKKKYKPKFIKRRNKYESLNNLLFIYKKVNFRLNYSYDFFNKNVNKNFF